MTAERRLSDSEMARGEGEAAEFADADEIPESFEIHGPQRSLCPIGITDSAVLLLAAICGAL